MKCREDHQSQASEYSPEMKIWFFNLRRMKDKCSKLASPVVVLAQISDVVMKMKMGPRALPRIIHADLGPF